MSPTKFLYYSNAVVIKSDKYTEELVLQIRKPARPSEAFIGKPGYYTVEEFNNKDGNMTFKQIEREARIEAKRIKDFYAAKGAHEPKLSDPKWYLFMKKQNFMEIVDQYKYSLSKILSTEQISDMRKQLKDAPKTTTNKNDRDFYCNKKKEEVVS